jgi:polysaccharide deacetylase family protein (PEP-CTERM system associated)
MHDLQSEKICNAFTVDVEDYFHVEVFSSVIQPRDWENYSSRVENNTNHILNILGEYGIKGTFFILGWVAEKNPELVKTIHRMGHEVASHGYRHKVIHKQTSAEFREDIKSSKELLEDLTGEAILGYRAPTYSITRETLWALPIIRDVGFLYDSSVFPIYHDNYGIHDAPRFPFLWDLNSYTPEPVEVMEAGDKGEGSQKKWANDPSFLPEFPISTVELFGSVNFPIGGGGYFRLLPYSLTRIGLEHINRENKRPFVFYIHPWEIDPNQPFIRNVSCLSKFRHYNNLQSCLAKLDRLLRDFKFGKIGSFFINKGNSHGTPC